MKRENRTIAVIGVLLLVVACSAFSCNTWERRTFQTLSSSHDTIWAAADDYESGKLPHTQPVYDLINSAKAFHNQFKDAYKAYWLTKQAVAEGTDTKVILAEKQRAVNAAMVQIVNVVKGIEALYTSSKSGG